MEKSVLISGASSGIGKALSLDLDRLGYCVFAGVRNEKDANLIKGTGSGAINPLMLDITDQTILATACKQVSDQTGGELDCLVNNAGINISAPMEFIPMDDFRQQMEVNLFGQLSLTQACLPMLRKSHGRIIFISSVAGRLVTPFNGPYAASKAALVSMADALRLELASWSLPVTVMVVGSVHTPIWEKAARTAGNLVRRLPRESWGLYGSQQKQAGKYYQQAGENGIAVQDAVKVIRRAIEKPHPKAYYLVGKDAWMIELMINFLPVQLRDWLVRRQMGLH